MPSPSSMLRAALVAGVASAASVELQPRQMVTENCAEVHLFLSRGNNEPYPGRQGKVVTAVCEGLKSCDYEDIQMKNGGADEYCGAVSEGTTNGVAQIIAYNKRCPNSKLVVAGFSQGAHVAGDLFGGGGGSFFNGCQTKATPNIPFDTPAGQAIAAIVTFGDVRHTANQPYNYLGGATHWGLFPRNSQQLANAIKYAGVWRDYCNVGDPICAGGKVTEEHLNYFDVYTPEVAEFIHQKLAAVNVGPSTSASASSAKPTVNTVSVPPHSSFPHGGNMTVTYNAPQSSQTVIAVTDTVGKTITVVTTVCPATLSYVPNPTAETKPPHISVTVKFPLPEATHSTTINLSAIPKTATGTIAPGTTAGSNSTVTHAVSTTAASATASGTAPASAGAASNLVKMGGAVAIAMAAAVALL